MAKMTKEQAASYMDQLFLEIDWTDPALDPTLYKLASERMGLSAPALIMARVETRLVGLHRGFGDVSTLRQIIGLLYMLLREVELGRSDCVGSESVKQRAEWHYENSTKALRSAGQKEYAGPGGDSAFGNFERVGKRLGLAPENVLMVYLEKHIDGIHSWVRGHRSQREDVTGRIADAIVYLFIYACMFRAAWLKNNPTPEELDQAIAASRAGDRDPVRAVADKLEKQLRSSHDLIRDTDRSTIHETYFRSESEWACSGCDRVFDSASGARAHKLDMAHPF